MTDEVTMRKILFPVLLITILSSCGKDNKVSSSGGTGEGTGVTPIETSKIEFVGNYDLVILNRMETFDCAASIRIIKDCSGYQLISNNTMEVEEFCNVNRGEIRNNARPSRETNRNPPNPDNNQSTTIVTQEGNQLKSVLKVGPNLAFTNTLTLSAEGVLTKVSHLKSRNSHCTYQKR